MHLVILHLSPARGSAFQRIEPAEAARAIRARAGPADPLEHLSTRPAPPHGLHLGFFYRTESEELARKCAEQLARRAVEEIAMFAGWQVGTPQQQRRP